MEPIGRKNCSNKTTADTTEKKECKNTAITTKKLLQLMQYDTTTYTTAETNAIIIQQILQSLLKVLLQLLQQYHSQTTILQLHIQQILLKIFFQLCTPIKLALASSLKTVAIGPIMQQKAQGGVIILPG